MANMPSQPPEPLAIIGIGCRFPGGANSPEAFWKLLVDGVDAVTEIPRERWDVEEYFHPARGVPGKMYTRWGGFLDRIEYFDNEFFGISAREAARIDPQQRLMLELTWEALEDGGQVPEKLAGSKTGVFVGLCSDDFAELQMRDGVASANAYTNAGGALSIVANRVSYIFDFHGPSFIVDTACSSSMLAVHLACQSVWAGESTLAIAAGVNIILGPERTIGFSQAQMLSPVGRCTSFDAKGAGYVRSEGAGVIVLKPLSQAKKDGDPIYALIMATATNQDGRTMGIALPNGDAQEALLREVYARAGIPPERVSYVEAHGTGTAAGDPIEVNALGKVLSANRRPENVCLLGSVKTNIGHPEGGSGIAGLIKLALALKHRQIPGNLHFKEPNPKIDFAGFHFHIPTKTEPWPKVDEAIAGINSFGFGGANAHAILKGYDEEPSAPKARADEDPDRPYLLPLSARSPQALEDLVKSWVDFLYQHPDLSLHDLCYSAGARKGHHEHRAAVVAASIDQLTERLELYVSGERRLGIAAGRKQGDKDPKVVFLFAGNGPQWWAMGRQLLEKEPVFRQTVEACDAELRKYAAWSLMDEMTADESASRMDKTEIAQPALFAVQAGLIALWRARGVEPDAVIGHSVGEVAAAYAAGILTFEDALRVIFHRSRVQEFTAGKGKMAALELSYEQAQKALARYEGRLTIGAINAPTSVTVSGDADALAELIPELEAQKIYCRYLKINYPFHSHHFDAVRDDLLHSLEGLRPRNSSVRMVSVVTGTELDAPAYGPQYWFDNIRKPVLFTQAVSHLFEDGYAVFLEIGPHPVLASYVAEAASVLGKKATTVPSLRRKEDERAALAGALATLYTIGYPLDWAKLYPEGGRFVRLPSYPWQKEKHWARPEFFTLMGETSDHPLLGRRVKTPNPLWHVELDKRVVKYLDEHVIGGSVLFPASGYMEMAIAVANQLFGEGPCVIEQLEIFEGLVMPENQAIRVQVAVEPDLSFAIYSQSKSGDKEWRLHAKGLLTRNANPTRPAPWSVSEIIGRCPEIMPKEVLYPEEEKRGILYLESFQGGEIIWLGDLEGVGRISAPDCLKHELPKYYFHPAVLDSCIQGIVTITPVFGTPDVSAYLPVKIEQVRFYQKPPKLLYSHARRTKMGPRWISVDCTIMDSDGNVVAELLGLRLHSIDFTGGRAERNLNDRLYAFAWQPQFRTGPEVERADFLPPVGALAKDLQAKADERGRELGLDRYYRELLPRIRTVCTAYIARAFCELGWDLSREARTDAATLMARTGLEASREPFVKRLLGILEDDGVLQRDGAGWRPRRAPGPEEPDDLWRQLAYEYPSCHAELLLLQRSASHLAGILRGEVNPLELAFHPKSGTTGHLYDSAPTFRLYNELLEELAAKVAAALPPWRKLRVLEIGAGTGGATTHVLPRLPRDRTEYVFSDHTDILFGEAEQKFRKYPFVQYQVLDIDADPTEQGFQPHSFDLILAANVLPETRDLNQSLAHVRQLLASDGLLAVVALGKALPWIDMVFGVHMGWEDRSGTSRGAVPPVPGSRWIDLLQGAGFPEAVFVADRPATGDSIQSVVLARGPKVQSAAQAEDVQIHPAGRWMVFADGRGFGGKVAESLRKRGQEVVEVVPGTEYQAPAGDRAVLTPRSPEDMTRCLEALTAGGAPLTGVIHCWSLDAVPTEKATDATLEEAQDHGCLTVTHLVQALARLNAKTPPRLWLVTAGAETLDPQGGPGAPVQFPIWGLGRVVMNEHPDLRCTLVDVSPSGEEVAELVERLFSSEPAEEILLRGRARYHHQLVNTPIQGGSVPKPRRLLGVEESFRLEIPKSGLDNLVLNALPRRQPAPGEVEVEVYATGINFKDVLQAIGVLTGAALEKGFMGGLSLGLECSGKVVRVGPGVEGLAPGDEVVAFGRDCFSAFLTTPAHLVARKPAHISFEEAATIPVTFATAYYALHHLGRLRRGEKVLIHGGAGGVGLAAIQIVQAAGGEVFATAGSPEKRDFLKALGVAHVMDSRSLDFADQVLALTGGEGVHVVLNSLAGEALIKSVSVLRPFGRFLEIGKRDFLANTHLGLKPFEKCLAFHAIDLDQLLLYEPELGRSMFKELMDLFERKAYHPLPYRVFSINNVENAFRYMQQSRHIGKIVVSMRDPEALVHPRPKPLYEFDPDATYLITGGLGGFGLSTADWMARKGARHLVLVGRSGAGTPEARETLRAMRQEGIEVLEARVDVTDAAQVADLVAQIKKTLPPLKGVVHAANVMDDGILLQLNRERFLKVLRPKMLGAWHLHEQTRDLPLDFFVLYSSTTTMLGNRGQGNYVAGNAFLDALARHRRSLGLPALVVNWGAIGDVGYLARNTEVGTHLERLGMKAYSAGEALEVLERLLATDYCQVGTMEFDWQQLSKLSAQVPARFARLMEKHKQEKQESNKAEEFRQAMAGLTPEQAKDLVLARVCEHLAAVLGTSAAKLDTHKPVTSLGVDSLMAVELQIRVKRELGMDLPVMKMMEKPTLEELAAYLVGHAAPAPAAPPANGQARAAETSPNGVNGDGAAGHPAPVAGSSQG